VTGLLLLKGFSSLIGCFNGMLFIRDFSERLSVSDSFLSVNFCISDWLFVSDESFVTGDLLTSEELFTGDRLYQWRVHLSVIISDRPLYKFQISYRFFCISD
jgi:hypothetical protein